MIQTIISEYWQEYDEKGHLIHSRESDGEEKWYEW